ncbi:MAG: EamA family transporter RarD [Alphaproteobacteria bacterium]|nr:EamA family transporter RarD [Alphaproteobacteria bacterium]MDE2630200.1 EamA family transporter RarD [Alphaproteobacteria bacterium]
MSDTADNAPPNEAAGILLAGAAYAIWGVFPLYWWLLAAVPPIELVIHRMLWCAIFAAGVTAARRRLRIVGNIVRSKRLISSLALSGTLIAVNWTIYIWSIATHQLVEASLGYYITPLLSIALGVAMLGEKLSRFRLIALVLAAIAVGVLAVRLGHFPWIALGLALSFGFYGYMRKHIPVDALDGLTIETGMLFPVTLAAVSFWAWRGTGAFPSAHFSINALLLFAGPVTAVPLAMFAAGARRVRMTTLGFLQYLSPTIALMVATLILQEKFTAADAAAFGCVWVALILVGLEGQLMRSLARQES